MAKEKIPNPGVDGCLAHPRVSPASSCLSLGSSPPTHHPMDHVRGWGFLSHSTDGETKTWRRFISSYYYLLLFTIILSKGSRNRLELSETDTCSSPRLLAGLPASFLAAKMPSGGIGAPAPWRDATAPCSPLSETQTCLQPSPASSLPPALPASSGLPRAAGMMLFFYLLN